MSKKTLKPVVAAIGAAFAGSMLMSGAASAAENPFGMSELNAGYVQIAGNEGKCGSGKCGGSKGGEGKCGGDKGAEGKCGGSKGGEGKCGGAKGGEGKCGGTKGGEGKCGAGKCGGKK